MREREEIGRAITLLAERSDSISTSAKIRQHYAEIQRALNMGVQVKAIVSTLNENGITISEKSFPTTWARIKKREQIKSAIPSSAKVPANLSSEEQTTHAPASSMPGTPVESNDPADISAIARSDPDMNQLIKAGRKLK